MGEILNEFEIPDFAGPGLTVSFRRAAQVKKKEQQVLRSPLHRRLYDRLCGRACSRLITLIGETALPEYRGEYSDPVRVNGYRMANIFLVQDRFESVNPNDYSVRLMVRFIYQVAPLVSGLSVGSAQGDDRGTHHVFNYDSYYDTREPHQGTIPINIVPRQAFNFPNHVPWMWGSAMVQILRVPIMGPYLQAYVGNGTKGAKEKVKVIGYFVS